MAFIEQAPEQAKRRYPERRNAHTWVKGQSGNPAGKRLVVERDTELRAKIEAKAEEIFRQIQQEYDGLSALETTLAKQAAVNLALAGFSLNTDMRARLMSSAGRILDKLSKAVAARRAAQPQPQRRPLLVPVKPQQQS